MWDPRSYIDTDFGLDADESFEPAEADEMLDPMTADHVMTVLGPIEPEELGATFMGEHLVFDVDEVPAGDRLDDPSAAIQELTSYVSAGARGIVDLAHAGAGRDLLALVDIARRVPAHVIAATGGAPRVVERDIQHGLGRGRVKPGLVLVDPDLDAWREVMRVGLDAGMPVLFSRFPGDIDRLDHCAVIADVGAGEEIPGWRVVSLAGHVDRLDDVARILAADHVHSMIAMGLDRKSLWHVYDGQPGLVFGMERLPLAMMAAGLEALDVRRVLIDNPATFLTRAAREM